MICGAVKVGTPERAAGRMAKLSGTRECTVAKAAETMRIGWIKRIEEILRNEYDLYTL